MKYTIKILFSTLFVYSLISSIFAIDSGIYGVVVDKKTQIPIENVNIFIEYSEKGTSSSKEGLFKIPFKKDGQVTINVTHVAYTKQVLTLQLPLKEQLIIALLKSSIDYEPVMVTGFHLERPLSDSPIITEVITSDDIKKYSSTSVLELLEKSIPNIKIMNDSHGTTMSIQGLDSKYFLFLIDGNRMAGETTGNIDFSRLNTGNIERIEMLSGGASTIYGSGAIGGVINIITKNNNSNYDLNIQTKKYSENNDCQSWLSLSLVNKEKSLTSNTNIVKKSSDGYSINGNIIQNIYNDISFNQKFSINLLSNLILGVSGTFYSHDTEDYNYNNKRRDKYYDKQFIVNSEYNRDNQHYFRLTWNYDLYEKYTLFEALDNEERIRSSHNLNIFNINYSNHINSKINYSLGIESYLEEFYSPSDLNYNPFAGYLGSDSLKYSQINSFFSQSEYLLNKNIHIISGIRYDISNVFGAHLGPHISILFKGNKYRLRFNASNNFKSPTLKELYMQWDHLGMFYINGNKDLKPETSNYVSISYEKFNAHSNFTVKSYLHYLENMIASVEELESDQMIYRNFKSVLMRGIDFYFKKQFNAVTLNSNFSFLSPYDLHNNIQLEGTNKVSINNNITYYLEKYDFNVNFNYKYVSETFYINGSIPEYHIVNVAYNYNLFKGIKISLGVDNLINTSSSENKMTVFPDTRYFVTIIFNKN